MTQPANEIATRVLDQVMAFESMLASSPDGQYLIPGISMADYGDSRLHLATHLTAILARTYPEFQFWKSEKLWDNDGLTIHWRRIPLTVEAPLPKKPPAEIERDAFLDDFTQDPRWKEITGFPGYWVSTVGTVFSMKQRRTKKAYITNKGQKAIRLSKDGKLYTRSVRKLVRETFGDQEDC